MENMIEEQSLVSFVIPCYNHAGFVQECIQSVIDQDYKNIELIIIDDGSRDNSVEKIKEMIPACQKRFARFEFRYRENKGLCATLNESLTWCRGEFFSTLASDDVAFHNKISFLIEKIKTDQGDVVFGEVTNNRNGKASSGAHKDPKRHLFYDLLIQKNLPAAPASLIKKDVIIEVGGFDVSTKLEDWEMWLRLADKNKVLLSYAEPVVFYRRHDNNITNNAQIIAGERIKIINKYKNRSQFGSAIRYANLQVARDLAESKKSKALGYFIRARVFNKLSIFILIKILTPGFALKKIRGMLHAEEK